MIIEIIAYIIAAALSLIGLGLTLISIPGVWLIYISTILVAIVNKFEEITPTMLIILLALTILSTFIDNIVNALGVKAMGGSIWGMIGAILGGFIGLIIGNIVGIILGPLIGAFLFEYALARKDFNASLKAGIGTFIGMIVTVLLKTGVNIGMIVFVITKLLR
jgi:uncharacterized protein YqgC (DUF456 family)